MKNRHLTEARKVKNDDYFININKDLIIKLKYPNTEIKEIYDLDYFTSAKNDRCKSNRNFLYSTCSNSSLTSSASSSSPRSSVRSENGSLGFDDDEAFTFQDFVSSILNSETKEHHVLIIQDIARLIELKFRDFKKSHLSQLLVNTNNINNNNNSIYLDSESDLFIKIAESIFKLASEEPNGILGARLKLRIQLENGKCVDMCDCFPYDASTLSTSDIIITLKQDSKTTGFRKFLQSFKLFANLGKYFPLSIDTKNFDIIKFRLY